jgi:hypothetical protein
MTKITFTVANDRNPEGWQETHEYSGGGWPSEVVRGVLDRYNATLRPHDIPRRLVSIDAIEASAPKPIVVEHRWTKTSLVTESGGYDRMRCEACGATGKRYGLGQFGVKLDAKYGKPKWRSCPGKAKA